MHPRDAQIHDQRLSIAQPHPSSDRLKRDPRDFRVGKKVLIAHGPFKGYRGLIKSTNENRFVVELEATLQTQHFDWVDLLEEMFVL